MEEMAAWHFHNDIEKAETALSRLKRGMQKLYSLDDDISTHTVEDDSGAQGDVANAPLEGETMTFWAIQAIDNENVDPVPLPSWFQLPIDNILLTWKKENDIWKSRLEKRLKQGKADYTPKQKEAFVAWKKMDEKILVLDKKKQAVVKNPETKSKATLKRTCMALVLHPSEDPEELWIRAGTGQKWTLKLLRGNVQHDAPIPAGMDHFEGAGYQLFFCMCMHIHTYIHIYIYIKMYIYIYIYI